MNTARSLGLTPRPRIRSSSSFPSGTSRRARSCMPSTTALSADDVQRPLGPLAAARAVHRHEALFSSPGSGRPERGVAEATGSQFRPSSDSNDLDRQTPVGAALAREMGNRPFPRFHTSLKATLLERSRRRPKDSSPNINRSGAFVKLDSLPARDRWWSWRSPSPSSRAPTSCMPTSCTSPASAASASSHRGERRVRVAPRQVPGAASALNDEADRCGLTSPARAIEASRPMFGSQM